MSVDKDSSHFSVEVNSINRAEPNSTYGDDYTGWSSEVGFPTFDLRLQKKSVGLLPNTLVLGVA